MIETGQIETIFTLLQILLSKIKSTMSRQPDLLHIQIKSG